MTSEEDVGRVFAQALPTLAHPIRGLVQCVGVSDNYPVVDFPPDKFKRLFDINVAGTFIVAQAVAREVIKTGNSASMVLIGSVSGSVSNRVSHRPTARQRDSTRVDGSIVPSSSTRSTDR